MLDNCIAQLMFVVDAYLVMVNQLEFELKF
jgi:hypothetical protein